VSPTAASTLPTPSSTAPSSPVDEAAFDAAVVPVAAPTDAGDARVAMDQPGSTDAADAPVELDQRASPGAADTPETTEERGAMSDEPDASSPAVDSPAGGVADPSNQERADLDLVGPEGASSIGFDDIVVPPRPPLPGALVTEAPGADTIDEHVALDPTPADVAVEEPAISDPPAADPSTDEPSTAADAPVADDHLPPSASEVEVVVRTPLDTRDDADGARATSDVFDAVQSAVNGAAAPHDASGAGTFDDVPVEDSQDPTPPDVRADAEAPADETSDAPLDPADADVEASGAPVLDPADADVEASDAPLDPADADVEASGAPVLDPAGADADPVSDDAVGLHTDAAASADAVADTAVAADEIPADVDAEESPDARTAAVTAVTATNEASAGPDTDAAASTDPGTDEASADVDTDAAASTDPAAAAAVPALTLRLITKTFGELRAVDAIDLTVPAGSFYGLVGPNGAGKTTTLSIIAGLLRPDGGAVTINGIDAKKRAREAKKMIGVLPDRLRTFDRLTGRQLLSYYGALRGLPSGLVESRTADLARAFDLVDALARPVSDYSAGMTKKVMLAGAMIHSPRLLVLDEPFEAVDPVSSGVILDILRTYVDHGGTVILSSHGMELVERVCSRVAVIVAGQVLAEGTVDEVRGEGTLEQRFRELSGGLGDVEGLEWLHTFSA
jgi:ABC-2 type transport system ATP-binding protein